MKKSTISRKGFTLVELLTVIAIIGILAAILIPTVGRVMDMAQRSAGQSSIRSIAQVYFAYSIDSTRPRSINEDTLNEWAHELAANADLNNATTYYLSFDPAVASHDIADGESEPTVIVYFQTDGTAEPNVTPEFANWPKSVTAVANLSTRAPSATTPLVWTVGLNTDGTWLSNSPYEGDGGHIGFVDGHVEWHTNLGSGESDGILTNYRTQRRTENIKEAIGDGKPLADRAGFSLGSADS